MASLSDKKFNAINNFLNTYIDPEASKYFREARKKGSDIEWLKEHWDLLEQKELWNRSFKSLDDLTLPPFKQMDNVYNSYPDYDKIPKAKLRVILDEGDFTEEQLKHHYDARKKSKEQIDKINEERWNAIDKQRNEGERAKEYDDSLYNKYLGNEYAKKHYIQGHPYQAVANEIAGKAAAGADFLPFPLSLGGPAIRTVQKWAADEPVANTHTALDWGAGSLGVLGKIVPGVKDFARTTTSRLADIFLKGKGQNTREIKSVVNAKLLKEQQEEAARELALIRKNLDNMTDRQLIEIEANTTNPILKSNIKALRTAKGEYQTAEIARGNKNVVHNDEAANRAADISAEKAEAYDKAINKTVTDAANIQPMLEVQANKVKGGQVYGYEGDPDALIPYFKNVPAEDIIKFEQANMQPKWYNTLTGKAILGAERKAVSNRIAGRRWDEIDYDPKYDEDKAIKDIISMYSDEWLNNRYPHMDDPLVKTAYDKWINDLRTGGNNLDKLYRIGEY